MIIYPDEAKPLLVVGRQRAGTRFVTNALNMFPEICIQGELPLPVTDYMFDFVKSVDRYYVNLEKSYNEPSVARVRSEGWLFRRQHLMFVLWANINQSQRLEADNEACKYYGYKRPRHEFHFDYYVEFFQENIPIFVYCVRNFVDNYLSIKSRWPDRSIDLVANEYVESLEQYKYMKKSRPNEVLLFNLDDFLKQGIDYLTGNIFAALDVEQTAPIIEQIREMGPRNSLEELGIDRQNSLTNEEMNYFRKRTELESLYADLCV